ncbi:MAG: tyrosine-type recombinase/integrase [Hydrogenophaga sp.]|uniref:tyrosine-type recombinase/integrase n=1 Tax=Hydrogenophaga sp. TaxID=1904254 RepID=UPI002734404F|nr:tyrosine-type recombinase/integrase [Hydrogenophaga sp.]MDP3348246.1 tyrosine-type recombinase/integrase [Hydrogenophaga sp.]
MKKKPEQEHVQLRTRQKRGCLKAAKNAISSIFTPCPQTPLQSSRFESFLKDLGPRLADMSGPLRVGLCCLAYEGVCSMHEFHALLELVTTATQAPLGSRVVIEDAEKRPNGYQVRLLSPRTQLALKQLDGPLNPSRLEEQITEWLLAHYPGQTSHAKRSVLKQVLLDASAWLYLCLPGSIYSYVRKEIEVPALPSTVLSRLKMAPQRSGELSPVGDALSVVEEIALEHALVSPETDASCLPTRTIELLKKVCSVPGGSAHIRVADHRARQQIQRMLAGTEELHQDEGHVSAILVSWVMHLFAAGSLQRKNPAISTISAYIDALIEPLASALVALKQPLAFLDSNQWHQLFEQLAQHVGPHAYGPALATFHIYAIDSYGCDPMLGIIFNKTDEIKVHANVVWPHEREELLNLAGTVSPDRRASGQIRAMAALGSAGLFRIGELMPLRVSQIVALPEGLQVWIDPAAKWHKGKGAAPRRTVFIPAGHTCDSIIAWAEHRRNESFNDDVFLFGDPNQQERLYRFAHCTRLLNRLLKLVTGDDTVSFHTLRHTSASERSLTLLYDGMHSYAVSPLDELQYSMGHSSRYTLWTTYFHFPEYVIRHYIDACPSVHMMEEKEAAFWLKGTLGALRKSKSRASADEGFEMSTRFFYSQVEQAAFGQDRWHHIPGHPVCIEPARLEAVPPQSVEVKVDLMWLAQTLRNILDIDDLDVLCSRMSCLPSHLEQVARAVASASHMLDPLTARRFNEPLLHGADPTTCVMWTRQVLSIHKLRFDFDKMEHLPALLKFASAKASSTVVADASVAWQMSKRGQAISLNQLHAIAPLVKLFLAAQVPATCLIARLQVEGLSKAKCQSEIDRFAVDWINIFGIEVPVETVAPRRGHPTSYLMVMSRPHAGNSTAPSASLPMHGVHGFFFCLSVLQNFNNSKVPQ